MLTDHICPDDDSLKTVTARIEERSTPRLKRFCALIDAAWARDAARLGRTGFHEFPVALQPSDAYEV